LSGLKYVKEKGVCTNALYPYKSGKSRDTGKCDTAKEAKCQSTGPKIVGLINVKQGDCNALADAVSKGPVVVAVDASKFGNYDGGIFGDCANPQINHAVTVVGYKQNSHWLVENSWGADWGEDGFMRLKWGNTCAVCNHGQYATV
jgi:C1A family cysteine protease